MSSPVLYHYTCADGFVGIRRDGFIKPGPMGMVWLTDMVTPNRDALGLTSWLVTCDRMTHRVTVDPVPESVAPWVGVRRELPREFVAMLEGAPGARPRHWWVGVDEIPVTVMEER